MRVRVQEDGKSECRAVTAGIEVATLPCATCGHRGIACHLAAAPKMAQKNRGPYSGTSVSLAFLMPSAVASITTSSFSFIEFRSTSMCFLQELDLAPPSA